MEEIEVPTEHLHETIQEKAEEASSKWSMYIAISTALMAVLAAIAGLLAGHHSNEALIEQVKASDQWAYYQAKIIKAEIRSLKPDAAANAKSPGQLKKEEEEIMDKAKDAENASSQHLQKHKTLAASVTLFQVAIAISAIAILTKKNVLWLAGVTIAAVGIGFFVTGFFS